jgi:hypothetical protein
MILQCFNSDKLQVYGFKSEHDRARDNMMMQHKIPQKASCMQLNQQKH